MLKSLRLRSGAHILAILVWLSILVHGIVPARDPTTVPLTVYVAKWSETTDVETSTYLTSVGQQAWLLGRFNGQKYIMPIVINGTRRRVVIDTASSGLVVFYPDGLKGELHRNAHQACLHLMTGEVSIKESIHEQDCISMSISRIGGVQNLSAVRDTDGILGLGFSTISYDHINMFALRLAHPSYGPAAPSEITFGGFRSENCDGRIQWIRLVASEDQNAWQAGLRQILLSPNNQWPAKPLNTKHPVCLVTREHNLCEAAVDSAVAVIAGPASYVHALLDSLQVDASCKNFDTLPAIFLEVSGDISANLAYTPVYLQLTRFEYIARRQEGTRWTCTPLFQTLPDGAKPPWLLGQPLLHRYYSIFDASLKRMGFALQKRPQIQDSSGAAAMAGGTCHDDEVEMAAWSLPNCAKFAEYGYCRHHKRVAARSCPATCGICKSRQGGKNKIEKLETRHVEALASVQGRGLRVVAASSRRLAVADEI